MIVIYYDVCFLYFRISLFLYFRISFTYCFILLFRHSYFSSPVTLRLLDVSPWGHSTDPLLFNWDELRDKQWEEEDFVNCRNAGVRQSLVANTSENEEDFSYSSDCYDGDCLELRCVTAEMHGKRVNAEQLQQYPQVRLTG